MSMNYDLYGLIGSDLEKAKADLEKVLSFNFYEKESEYHGGIYYFCGDKFGESFLLKSNVDLYDGGPVEQNHKEFSILLYVNGADRCEQVEVLIMSLSGARLLRREAF